MGKNRLDMALVEQGLAATREKARAAILAGLVFVNGQRVDKAGTMVPLTANISITGNPIPYVSRGGLKLAKALECFSLDVKNKIILDVGASTGGFTDVCLKKGAKKVFSVDVGYGQLAWELRQDPRVVCLERTNIRYLTVQGLGTLADMATIDVSFISLEKVLTAVNLLLKSQGSAIVLIKPQFEAGREKVGKKGVVKDPAVHQEVIEKIWSFANFNGWILHNLSFSPITGPEGNIEYLAWLQKTDDNNCLERKIDQRLIIETVLKAHEELVKKV